MNLIAVARVKRSGRLLEIVMLIQTLVTGFVVGFVALAAIGHLLLLRAALLHRASQDDLRHASDYGPAAVTAHAIRH